MAKVKGKKAAVKSRKVSTKKVSVASRPKSKKAAPARKSAPKKAAKAPAKKPVPKPAARAAKPAPKPAPKTAPKAAAKPAPPKPPASRPATKPSAARPATTPVKPPPPAARAADSEKKRSRRSRPRVQSDGTPMANWFSQGEKPRPSSFIPAPPRAEAPSLIAAPPASSDRLIRPEDVSEIAVRIVPVRVNVEQTGGRVFLAISPDEVVLGVGEGIEWDFRYFGGADVTVEELVVEFEKPSPFGHSAFRSRKPGTARPHRQLSGAAQKSAAGKKVQYVIRAMTPFKTELAVARPSLTVQG